MLQAGLSQTAIVNELDANKSVSNRLSSNGECEDHFIRQAFPDRTVIAAQIAIRLHDTHQNLVGDHSIGNGLLYYR